MSGRRKRWTNRSSRVFLPVLFIMICLVTGCRQGAQTQGSLSLSEADREIALAEEENQAITGFRGAILNTGKSDCTILQWQEHAIMIDTADRDDSALILQKLEDMGIRKLDLLILSHYDKDHIGSSAYLVSQIPIDRVVGPAYEEDSQEFWELQAALRQKDTELDQLVKGEVVYIGEVTLSLDAPQEQTYKDENNFSLITTISYEGQKLLFTGDALKNRMEEFLTEAAEESTYTLMKLPHHGSYSKSLKKFMEAFPAENYVICAAGEMTIEEKTLQCLTDRQQQDASHVFKTYQGEVSLETDSDGRIWVSQK